MTINYSKKVMKLFKNPKNVGIIKNADGIGEIGNLQCGDVMKLYIRVGKNSKGEEIIKDVKFKTFGCCAAIASASMTTELAKGKTIQEAEKISKDDIAKALKGLPAIKMHCSNLASDALKKAIGNYKGEDD